MKSRKTLTGNATSVEVLTAARLAAADIAVITDASQAIVFASESFSAMTGHRPEHVVGRNCRLLQGPGTNQETVDEIRHILALGQTFEGEILNYRRDGSAFWNALRIAPLRIGGGEVTHFVSVQRDITNRMAMIEQLKVQARYDPMTGLPNRVSAESAVEDAAASTARQDGAVGVGLIDLDDFRSINNSLGHAAGDAVLQQWAIRFQARLRDTDVLARMGGDEFLLIIRNIDRAAAHAELAGILAQLHRAVEKPFAAAGQQVQLGMSLGIALMPEGGTDSTTILRQANEALLAAKTRPNGHGIWWEVAADAREPSAGPAASRAPATQQHPAAWRSIGSGEWRVGTTPPRSAPDQYQAALRRGDVTVELQPIINLQNGSVHLFEVLARLELAGGRLAYPGQFLPHFDDADLGLLFSHVLDQGLGFLAESDSAGKSFAISVNLPPVLLKNPGTLGTVRQALLSHGIEPRRLGLELLESEALDMETQRGALQDLVDLGVGLAMDDLGSGYSSLQRLSSFPFSSLKLDRGLLLSAYRKPVETLSLMATLVQMGRDFGMNVVIEGLEDENLTEAALILGSPLGQGFYLARPLPVPAVMDWESRFALTLHKSSIQTPLGALAYHWQFARLGTAPPVDLAHCPLTDFLSRQDGAGDVMASHARMHTLRGMDGASSRILIDWLTCRIQAERSGTDSATGSQ